MKIGENIRKIRELKGYKQDFMAEKLNMTQANYSKIEATDTDISISRLQDIAEALNIPLSDIINFDKQAFFSLGDNIHSNTNISLNDHKILDELINSKNQVIALQEKTIENLNEQITFVRSLLKNTEK